MIAAVDLGLKTFATLSVYNKTREIDRKFLDQKHLGGKKTDWFHRTSRSYQSNGLKGKLMDRRLIARRNQFG